MAVRHGVLITYKCFISVGPGFDPRDRLSPVPVGKCRYSTLKQTTTAASLVFRNLSLSLYHPQSTIDKYRGWCNLISTADEYRRILISENNNRPPHQWFDRLPGRLELVTVGSYVPRDWVRVAQGWGSLLQGICVEGEWTSALHCRLLSPAGYGITTRKLW
jgi:hypothetical protein